MKLIQFHKALILMAIAFCVGYGLLELYQGWEAWRAEGSTDVSGLESETIAASPGGERDLTGGDEGEAPSQLDLLTPREAPVASVAIGLAMLCGGAVLSVYLRRLLRPGGAGKTVG